MTNLAELYPSTTISHSYLGPAQVLEATPLGRLRCRLGSGAEVEAQLALAFAYQPAEGDSVLAIGNDDGHYVIGVLATVGAATIRFPGDVELAAAGELRLRGERGVAVEGKAMRVDVGKLELAARSVSQRFHSLRQSIADLWSVRAGNTHTVVDGSQHTRAGDSSLVTKGKVSINGKAIHLGG